VYPEPLTVSLVQTGFVLDVNIRKYLFAPLFFRIVFFLAVALTSSVLIIERMEGLLDRSWVAGTWAALSYPHLSRVSEFASLDS
jgi:hypothetical protein